MCKFGDAYNVTVSSIGRTLTCRLATYARVQDRVTAGWAEPGIGTGLGEIGCVSNQYADGVSILIGRCESRGCETCWIRCVVD